MKWPSLHKSMSKLMPKKFYEIEPWIEVNGSDQPTGLFSVVS